MIPPVCTMRRNAPNCDCEIQTFMGECELLNRNFPLFPNKAAKHEQLRVYQDHQSLVQALVDELRSPAHTQGSLWECLLKLEPEDRAALEIAYECSPVMLDFIRNRVPLEELNEAYKAKIIEIQRVGINEPFLDCHRDELKNFIDLLKDPSKAVDDHRRGFDSLHKDIKEYLFYIVYITWRGELGDVGFNFGEERILGDPSLLLGLLTPSGDSFLGELLEILDVQHDLHCVEQALSGLIAENQTLSPDLQILSLKTKDLQDLCLRMGEKSPRFNHLAEQFCMSLDAPVEDRLNYLSQLQALIEKVAGDFSFDSCRGRAKQLRYLQQVGPKTFHYTKTSMEKVRVASNRTQAGVLNLLIVSYELGNRWGIKFGGLGEAVASRVAALKMRGHNVTVISPDFRYRQTPNGERRIPELSTPETTCERMTYNINGQEKLLNVHSTQTDTGIELVRLDGGPEQFFDICGNSTGIYQDGHHGVGKDKWYGLKERMAYFGAVCAAYLEKRLKYEALDPNSLKTDVIEFNDWHGALAIDLLYKEVKSKFHGGKISEDSYYKGNNLPAIVFVCHNNCFGAQGVFRGDEAEIVANFGGEAGGFNVAQRALERSDMSLTVSRTFAEEMQTEVLGAGMEQWVRRAAHSGRFKGIINGSNPTGYDPSTSPQLTGWVDPETQVHTPLAYSTESQNIAGHRKVMKKQLGKWITAYGDPKAKAFLEKCGGTDSLVEKDVVYFVGRYDSTQKGLEQFKYIMRHAHGMGAVFICMGYGEDETANAILNELEAIAERENLPAWIQRGSPNPEGPEVGSRVIQASVGHLIRACSTVAVVPSKFEPCGLVQFESWLFGVAVAAVNSGGLRDTVKDGENGFVFERKGLWDSDEQGEEVEGAIEKALTTWRDFTPEQKQEFSVSVMKAAQSSSWTVTPDRSPAPVDEYVNLYLLAIERAKRSRDTFAITSMPKLDYSSQELFELPYFQTEKPLYDVYGVQFDEKKPGTATFRVAAPRAYSVSLVIDGREDSIPMKWNGDGSFSATADEIAEGMIYSYQIEIEKGVFATKSDPFAFSSVRIGKEMRSVVANPNTYDWGDDEWMRTRKEQGDNFYKKEGPTNIYEVKLGEFERKHKKEPLNYREYAPKLAAHCKEKSVTHIELFGVLEYPLDVSMGYLVSGFFSPTSRYGSIEDFQYMIDYFHREGIAVVLDFIPGHFSMDQTGMVDFDGKPFFEHPNSTKGVHHLWGSKIFNFESENIRNFLIASAKFFADKMHFDGFRIDALQSITDLDFGGKPEFMRESNIRGGVEDLDGELFLKELNSSMKEYDPSISMVSEDSSNKVRTTSPAYKNQNGEFVGDGLGFEGNWHMHLSGQLCNLYKNPPNERGRHFWSIIEPLRLLSEKSNWLLERSHDRYDDAMGRKSEIETFARGVDDVVSFHCLFMTFPFNRKLNFMGNDTGASEAFIPKVQRGVADMKIPQRECISKVTTAWNKFYKETPAFWQDPEVSFQNVARNEDAGIIEFRRKDRAGKVYRVVHNLSDTNFEEYNLTKLERIRAAKIVMSSEADKQDRDLTESVIVVDEQILRLRLGPFSSYVIEEDLVA